MASIRRLSNVLQESLKKDYNKVYSETESNASSDDGEKRLLLPKTFCKKSFYLPARFMLAFWSCLGFVCMFTLRMDLNLTILDMVRAKNGSIAFRPTNTSQKTGKFCWSEHQQYILLSAFYYGYCSTQILGGYLAGRVGGKLVFGLASVASSLLGLVTPWVAVQSYSLLIVCRVCQGLAQGLAQPCMHTIWSKWAPENERSILMTITYAGCQLGNIIATIGSGYLCSLGTLGGWPLTYYVYGGTGMIWSAFWFTFVYDSPSKHPRITDHERNYIEQSINVNTNNKNSTKTAWGKVLRSPALLGIIAAQFANDWGSIALVTCLPMYLKYILQYDLAQNGLMSSLPFTVILVTNPMSGIIADLLRSKRVLSTKNTRKLMNSIGLFIPSVLILAVVFWDNSRVVVVTLCTLAVGVSGFTMAGYSVNHLDIAPTISGVLYGITNTLGTTVGFIGPVVLSVLTSHVDTTHQWNIFFYITSGIFFIGGLLFLLFAEGEPQNWSLPKMNSSDPEKHTAEDGNIETHQKNNVHNIQNND